MPTTASVVTAVTVCLGALTIVGSPPVRDPPKIFRLLLLHTNDMHSRFDQYTSAEMECDPEKTTCYGGFPRLKTAVVHELQKARRNRNIDGTLFLNAGDTFRGTKFYSEFKWPIVAKLLPKLDIDVMCLGNHEFDEGVGDLESFLSNIETPVVVSNIDLSEEPSLAAKTNLTKSKEVVIKNRRIGIIGYLTPDTVSLSNVGRVRFSDEVKSIREEARRLKSDGVDIIIALGHSGFEMDKKIALEVEEVDVVVGGHTNTFLYNGPPPAAEKPVGPYPYCAVHPETGRRVPVVQAFQITKYLGKLLVEFDENGRVLESSGNPILIDSLSFKPDPDLSVEVKKYQDEFDAKKKEFIGSTNVPLIGSGNFCRLNECNLGNFIADAYVLFNARKNLKDYDPNDFWTDAAIALQHSGGIRANIEKSESGDITYYQLMITLPFRNNMGKVRISGLDIHRAIEHAFKKYNPLKPRGVFLQVSGLKITVDLSKPSGNRVVSILVKSTLNRYSYEKLDLEEMYMVIMSEFMWTNGDGYTFETSSSFKSIGPSDFEIVAEEIREKSPISPVVEDRIKILNTVDVDAYDSVRKSSQNIEYVATACGNPPMIQL